MNKPWVKIVGKKKWRLDTEHSKAESATLYPLNDYLGTYYVQGSTVQ